MIKDHLLGLIFELGRTMKQEIGEMPISFIQYGTMNFVSERGDPTMKEVANYLKIKAPSATLVVEELANKKLLTRSADATDRRIIKLSLTKEGERMLNKINDKRAKVMKSRFEKLSASEREHLAHILKTLIGR